MGNNKKIPCERLNVLMVKMLLNNAVINNELGEPLNVNDLFHKTSINSLNNIRHIICESINNSKTHVQFTILKEYEEFINLLIEYKRSIEKED